MFEKSFIMTLPKIVENYLLEFRENFPNTKILPKNSSKIMNFLSWIFSKTKINPRFNEYYTTLGDTIYLPENAYKIDGERLLQVIMHECLHIEDYHKNKFLYVLFYGFPQILSPLFLLGFLGFLYSPMFFLFLFALCLAPFPAYGRYYYELRAYRVSVLFGNFYQYSENEMEEMRQWIIKNLAERYYYFTWPFPRKIYEDLKDFNFLNEKEYIKLRNFLEDNSTAN